MGFDAELKKIRGDLYHAMIDRACEYSDAVMLVFEFYSGMDNGKAENLRDLRASLMPYLLSSRNNGQRTLESRYFGWPGTSVGYLDPTDPAAEFYSGDCQIYVDVYALSDFVKEALHERNAFTDWWPSEDATDIAFFKDQECWFFTTVHEDTLGICDHEQVFAPMLDEAGISYQLYERKSQKYIEPYRQK